MGVARGLCHPKRINEMKKIPFKSSQVHCLRYTFHLSQQVSLWSLNNSDPIRTLVNASIEPFTWLHSSGKRTPRWMHRTSKSVQINVGKLLAKYSFRTDLSCRVTTAWMLEKSTNLDPFCTDFNKDVEKEQLGEPKGRVAEWYTYRIVTGFVTSSSPMALKTRRVGQRFTLNLSRAETSSRWCGVVGEGVPTQVSSTSLDHGKRFGSDEKLEKAVTIWLNVLMSEKQKKKILKLVKKGLIVRTKEKLIPSIEEDTLFPNRADCAEFGRHFVVATSHPDSADFRGHEHELVIGMVLLRKVGSRSAATADPLCKEIDESPEAVWCGSLESDKRGPAFSLSHSLVPDFTSSYSSSFNIHATTFSQQGMKAPLAFHIVARRQCLVHCCSCTRSGWMTATAGSDVVQSGRPIFDDFFQQFCLAMKRTSG
ncbi:hypothetical protein TNCV_4062131 [Trichonephila clavipes]|nr:hypothetical protein TNCV_4062131 [Trichonephila clavipes]